jgi:hypothetical protein
MLRASELFQEFDPTAAPRLELGDASALANDSVDFFAEKELGEARLHLLAKAGYRFIANGVEGAPRDRVLVVLDLPFDVQLILVSERARCVLRHYPPVGRNGLQPKTSDL